MKTRKDFIFDWHSLLGMNDARRNDFIHFQALDWIRRFARDSFFGR
jgi:hypothetical protein